VGGEHGASRKAEGFRALRGKRSFVIARTGDGFSVPVRQAAGCGPENGDSATLAETASALRSRAVAII
jgi:hypothetical protein